MRPSERPLHDSADILRMPAFERDFPTYRGSPQRNLIAPPPFARPCTISCRGFPARCRISCKSENALRWPAFLAAVAKPLIELSTLWQGVFAARLLDRLGAGIRSAPHDALIASSMDEKNRGRAFGLESLAGSGKISAAARFVGS